MAEIRSTLDIIMEKAKRFDVTEEEKVQLQKKEVQDRARGMLQKYLDGLLGLKELQKEFRAMREETISWAKEALVRECHGRLDFEKDNKELLLLLEEVIGIDCGPCRQLIEEFKAKIQQEAEKRKEQLEKELRRKGIRGNAVIPNYRAAPGWEDFLEAQRSLFKEKLGQILGPKMGG